MNHSQIIYDHAHADFGLSEIAGPKSSPRIKFAIHQAATWLDTDDSVTAWCGCIRGLWGMETATGVPKAHYRAAEWLEWGAKVELKDAIQGDTVILKRTGGHHVALLNSKTSGGIYLLGGNQSNKVNISRFPLASIVGIRRG